MLLSGLREERRCQLVSITERPVFAALAGATAIASSAILVRLADASPATVAVFRCLYALPILALLMVREDRKHGPRARRDRWVAAAAGIFFGFDLILWHLTIGAAGAGIATVLGNLQVVIVGFAAWLLLGERPGARLIAAVPVVLLGGVLISGVVGEGAYGSSPMLGVVFGLGTSVAYAGFLLVLRHGARDLRRVAGPLFDVTVVAAVTAVVLSPLVGGIDLLPTWPSHGWLALLATSAQVVGWLLISVSLPRLPAVVTSIILLLQPVLAVLVARMVLSERPSAAQLAGCVIILAGVVAATTSPRRPRPAAEEPAVDNPVVVASEVQR